MTFSSATFLFAFFPAVFLLYRIIPGIKAKNILLTAASLIFYAFGQIRYLPLLLASVLCNYLAGRFMHGPKGSRRPVLAAAAVIQIAALIYYKLSPAFPIGISFFIFQGLSYAIDTYRDKEAVTNDFGKLLLYISLFPQLIAGPIVKYHDVAEQIDNRSCTVEKTSIGIRRFILGLAKKLLLANTLGQIADNVYALPNASLDIRVAWLGAVCYALQIYFDFSGYSDMAIGLGHCFGFTFLENFNFPYIAASIKDFWRRWHISLSTWFRDYLYIPLGGNRKGDVRSSLNKWFVFLCTGIWHGASWTFVIWGLWHGLFLFLEDFFPIGKLGKIFGRVYTLLVVVCGFVIFRSDNMAQAASMLGNLFAGFSFSAAAGEVLLRNINSYTVIIMVAAVVAAAGVLPIIQKKAVRWAPALEVGSYCASALLLLVCVLDLSASTFNPFIYYRF